MKFSPQLLSRSIKCPGSRRADLEIHAQKNRGRLWEETELLLQPLLNQIYSRKDICISFNSIQFNSQSLTQHKALKLP